MPYIIAPEGVKETVARKKAAEKLLTAMVKTMKHGGEKLTKPNIIFKLYGQGNHYLEWATEIYENDVLAQAWHWDTEDEKKVFAATRIQSNVRGRRARHLFKFVYETCAAALMALVVETRLNHEHEPGMRESATVSSKVTKDLVKAANGERSDKQSKDMKRPHIPPIQGHVTMVQWKLITDGIEVKNGTRKMGKNMVEWQSGTLNQAVSKLKSQAATRATKTSKVALRWQVGGKRTPRSPTHIFPSAFAAMVFLEYAGLSVSELKEIALDELNISAGLVEYYTSTAPAFFRALRNDRPYVLRGLIETMPKPDGAASIKLTKLDRTAQTKKAQGLRMYDSGDGRKLQDVAAEVLLANGGAKTCAYKVLMGGDAKDVFYKIDGPVESKKTTEKLEDTSKFHTETLRGRAERLGCDFDMVLDQRQERHLHLLSDLHKLIDDDNERNPRQDNRLSDQVTSESSHLKSLYDEVGDRLAQHEHLLRHSHGTSAAEELGNEEFCTKLQNILEYWTTLGVWTTQEKSDRQRKKKATRELREIVAELIVYPDIFTKPHPTRNDLIEAIVLQSSAAIERRKRRREARIRGVDFEATTSDSEKWKAQEVGKLIGNIEEVTAGLQKQQDPTEWVKMNDDDNNPIAEVVAVLRQMLSLGDATEEQMEAVVDAIYSKEATTPTSRHSSTRPGAAKDQEQPAADVARTLKRRMAKTNIDSSLIVEDSGSPTVEPPELKRLVPMTKWSETFRDKIRETPTLGALLGLPLELDDIAFTRLVIDIQRHVELPKTEQTSDLHPLKTIQDKIADQLYKDEHETGDIDTTKVKEFGEEELDTEHRIGHGFWKKIVSPKCDMHPDEDKKAYEKRVKKAFETEWGDKTIRKYMEWLQANSIDLMKVRHYFSCNHSEGVCRTPEDELRGELNKLPFTAWEDRGTDAEKRTEHMEHHPNHPGHPRDIPLDRGLIEFGDRMISMFSNVVQGVVNSTGWLLFPAGRGPQQQLLGETINRYKGDLLTKLVWMQYAALQNPRLGGAENHDKFVKQLLDSSIEINDQGEKAGEVVSRVFYPSDRLLFPTAADVQGLVCDDDGHEMNAQDWLEEKVKVIEDQRGDVQLHPSCTHLIFWDCEGEVKGNAGSRPLEQPLPYDNIEAMESVLGDEGVAEGSVLVNGDEQDFEMAKHQVAKSDPVLCLRSIGGASDFMASIFIDFKEKRHTQEDNDRLAREDEVLRTAKKQQLTKLVGSGGYWGRYRLRQEANRHHVYSEVNDDDDIDETIDLICEKHVDGAKRGTGGAIDATAKGKGKKKKKKKKGNKGVKSHLEERYRRGEQLNERFKPQDTNNPRSGKFYFQPRRVCDETEMIAIDVAPEGLGGNNAGEKIQKQLAEMLAMQGDERERVLGFEAAEYQRLSASWDQSLHYENNAYWQKVYANLVQISMLVINLLLVAIVVFKQAMYPSAHSDPCASYVHNGQVHVADDGQRDDDNDDVEDTTLLLFKISLTIMPILNGIFLTLDSAFAPTQKRNALRWTAAKMESEVYQYRARSCKYSPINTNLKWSFMARQEDDRDDVGSQGKVIAATTFVKTITKVSNLLLTDGVFVKSHLSYPDEHEREERRQQKMKQLKEKALFVTCEEVNPASEDRAPKTEEFVDDGYGQLNAAEYIACRTEPLLAELKKDLPVLGKFDMVFNTAIFIVTTISVILGAPTFTIDLPLLSDPLVWLWLMEDRIVPQGV